MMGRIGRVCLVTAVVGLAFASHARACDTPVYRYAMYRWLPAPYELYYFHDGELSQDARQIKEAVDSAAVAAEAPTNVVFLSVDLAKDKELVGVPPDIKEAWQKQDQPQVPSYLVTSPVGGRLFQGSLSLADLDAMIDSPARQQVAQALGEGKAGVYILLTSDNVEANEQAEQVVQSVLDDVAAGKISLYRLPNSVAGESAGDESSSDEDSDEGSDGSKLEVGLVKVARGDPREKWLVEMLLSVERDLRDTQEPLVFMIYGRGRALPPCLGKGIHRDNLIQDVEFITGACSCTVKEQNPGVDLLMRYDWETAAEAIGARFGAEEGSRYEFGGDALFPELIIPLEGEMPGSGDGSTSTLQGDAVAQAEPAATDPPVEKTPLTGSESPAASVSDEMTAEPGDAKDLPGEVPVPKTQTISLVPYEELNPGRAREMDAASNETPATFRGVLWVGTGLLGALVVLFVATLIVLRPR